MTDVVGLAATDKTERLFYMHVAKTGGTSFNAALQRLFPPGSSLVHIEHLLHQGGPSAHPKLRDARFLSGHVSYPSFQRHFSKSAYFLLATVRRPTNHLWSHLNWVKHLSDPGRETFLAGHPAWVTATSAKIRGTDFTDAASTGAFITSLTENERGLFDNCQTRYFAGPLSGFGNDRDRWSHAALSNMQEFDLVGLTEQLDDSYAMACLRRGGDIPAVALQRLNQVASDLSFDALPASARDQLYDLVRQDDQLFAVASSRFADLLRAVGVNAPQESHAGSPMPAGRLHIDSVGQEHRVLGWYVAPNRRAPAWLKLVFDGSTTVFVKADQLRPGVLSAGLHHDGRCGFSYTIPATLRATRTVDVYVLGNPQVLASRKMTCTTA